MAEKRKLETAEKRIRTAYSKFWVFSLVVGLVALLATVAGVVIMLRTEKNEISAQVLSCGELTKYSPIAELKGQFTYAGEDVAHLWKLTVKFVNSGGKTIVGQGSQKNIIGEGLNFVFPDGTRILNVEEEADTFQSTIVQLELNHLQIQFSQWRSGEYLIASFYVASDEPLAEDPLLDKAQTRDIVDGDIIIDDLTQERIGEPTPLIDRFPRAISTPGKIIGAVYAGAIAILMLILVPWGWKDSFPTLRWKRRYLSNFIKYLEQFEPPLDEKLKQKLRRKPRAVPKVLLQEKFWDKFEGPEVPQGAPLFDSVGAGIFITLLFLFFAFGFISLMLAVIQV